MEYILTFGSAHRALKAEEVLKGADARFRLKPAPKALEPYCDLVISIKEEDLASSLEVLKKGGVAPKSMYRKEGDEYVKV